MYLNWKMKVDFYGPYGHPYDHFLQGLMYIHVYIYIYMFVSLTQVCVVYVVKEVTSFRGLGQLMGVARKRTRIQTLQTSRKKAV